MAAAEKAPAKTAAAASTSKEFKPPSGFEQGGSPDVDGWFKPESMEIVDGQIVGHIRIKGDQGERDVILVKLRAGMKAFQTGGAEVELAPGQILGLTINHQLKEALLYVENKGSVYIQANEKKKLKGGKSMWTFNQFYKGKKAPLQSVAAVNSAGADDDDIPF